MRYTICLVDRSIRVKTGTEGPSFDPYAYTEYTLVRDGQPDVVFHAGLGVSLKIGKGLEERAFNKQEENLLFARFECLVGWPINDLEKWSHKARQRCRKCRCKHGHWAAGYPGESFLLCDNCGEHMDYSFDESAVI